MTADTLPVIVKNRQGGIGRKGGFVRQQWRTSVQPPEDLAPYRGRNGRCGLRLPPRFMVELGSFHVILRAAL